jgi:hypothetical protein
MPLGASLHLRRLESLPSIPSPAGARRRAFRVDPSSHRGETRQSRLLTALPGRPTSCWPTPLVRSGSRIDSAPSGRNSFPKSAFHKGLATPPVSPRIAVHRRALKSRRVTHFHPFLGSPDEAHRTFEHSTCHPCLGCKLTAGTTNSPDCRSRRPSPSAMWPPAGSAGITGRAQKPAASLAEPCKPWHSGCKTYDRRSCARLNDRSRSSSIQRRCCGPPGATNSVRCYASSTDSSTPTSLAEEFPAILAARQRVCRGTSLFAPR